MTTQQREHYMNSMELVRFPTGSLRPSLSSPTKRLPPPFPTELIGPVRNAIVRARQLLISRQRDDGTWIGRHSTDVSLPSQLVFLHTYLERGDAELLQQCAATILHAQQPDGGWSAAPEAASDVSASVQAYFALKLTGLDPSGESLSRARQRIRQLGGADAADFNTRFFLALLGQVDYDCCEVRPPETIYIRVEERRLQTPRSLVCSHRPVRQIGVERGVRELFISKPKDWPRSTACREYSRIRQLFGPMVHKAVQVCERRGWTPFRPRALARCESQLIQHTNPAQISELDFTELIWHTIALHTIGYGADSTELQRCEERVREMVFVDDDLDVASAQLRDTRWSDTAVALQSLLVSGLSTANSAVTTAVEAILKGREGNATRTTADVCSLMQLLHNAEASNAEIKCALPPELEIWWDSQFATAASSQLSDDGPERCPLAIGSTLEQLRASQNRDGGWSAMLSKPRRRSTSDPAITAHVIEAIAPHATDNTQPIMGRAVAFLRTAQVADGSWSSSDGRQSIQCTSKAIRALLAAGVTADDDAVAAAVNWLIVQQQPHGGWRERSCEIIADECESSSRRRTSALQTAWAILALVAAGRANDPATRHGVDFLLDSQDEDGAWVDREWASCDPTSRRWFSNDLESIASPLRALSAWAVDAGATKSEAADQLSLRLVNALAEN